MDSEQAGLSEEEEPPRPKKKEVQFHKRGSIEEVRRISRLSTYGTEEVIAYWGNNDEYRLRKQELKEAVIDWHYGRRNSDNMTFTAIGIEDQVGEGRALRKEIRSRSRSAVLEEQALQGAEGSRDDELLADVYKDTSQDAEAKARQVAQRIANDVRRFNDSDFDDVQL
jgi:hypothetical protein